jgi:hypothetical protein
MSDEYRKCLEAAGIPDGPAYQLGPIVVVEAGSAAPTDISQIELVKSVREIQDQLLADTVRLTQAFVSGVRPQ